MLLPRISNRSYSDTIHTVYIRFRGGGSDRKTSDNNNSKKSQTANRKAFEFHEKNRIGSDHQRIDDRDDKGREGSITNFLEGNVGSKLSGVAVGVMSRLGGAQCQESRDIRQDSRETYAEEGDGPVERGNEPVEFK